MPLRAQNDFDDVSLFLIINVAPSLEAFLSISLRDFICQVGFFQCCFFLLPIIKGLCHERVSRQNTIV
ncbi:hypothetical protein BC829DRAFT_405480 [Chytridium lagenaria]|nr:hypothetical protein BC829DRAFT_405480 [Chytridium lagenaria]